MYKETFLNQEDPSRLRENKTKPTTNKNIELELYIFKQCHNFLYVMINSCLDIMFCSDLGFFGSYKTSKQCFQEQMVTGSVIKWSEKMNTFLCNMG